MTGRRADHGMQTGPMQMKGMANAVVAAVRSAAAAVAAVAASRSSGSDFVQNS